MPHKLLLADDSITIQRVIELTFADEDVDVLAVGDGKKAIESIQANRPDIVLADVGMPERDGYEVAEFVKRNRELANIPVVLLTGAFEPIDETRARAVGCDGVLVKPFEPQMVINRVKDLLAGRRSGGLWGAKPGAAPDVATAPVEKGPGTPPAAPPAPAASASLEEYFDRLDAAFASVEAATEARSAAAAIPPPAPAVMPSSSTAAATSAAGLSTDDLPGWDPDLMGDPQRAAAAVTVPTQPPPIQVRPFVEPPPAPEPPSPVQHVAPPPLPAVAAQVSAAPPPTIIPAAAAKPPVAEPPVAVATPPPIERPAPPVPRPAASVPQAPASGTIPSLAEAFAALLSAEQGRRVSPSTVGAPVVSDDMVEAIVKKVVDRMTDQAVRDTVIDVAERLVREEIGRIKTGH